VPGFLLHLGATVMCMHGGQAQPTAPFPRVLVSGQPVTTLTCPYVIAGCGLTSSGGPFCATAQWVAGATRVFAGGAPVLLQTGQALCTATGTGLIVAMTQTKVTGT
jgi:hypothetical protein